jgi:hypothetical protein
VPARFDTVTLYAAPVCSWMKLPATTAVTLSTGLAATIVLSLMLLPAEPPPDTAAEFDSTTPASEATFTVTVITG